MNNKKITGSTTGDILAELFELAGKRVVDAGCGDGKLVRMMAGHGAVVFGVEPSADQVARARAAKPVAGEQYAVGGAEDLPFDPHSVDLVVFSNSLHHVPKDLQAPALGEAARILKSGGHVFVAEPMPGGAHKELLLPVQDETEVQAQAYQALQDAAGHGLIALREETFDRESFYRDYDHFRDAMTRVDANRATAFAAHEADLRHRFATLGRAKDGGRLFDQPIRINIFRKA